MLKVLKILVIFMMDSLYRIKHANKLKLKVVVRIHAKMRVRVAKMVIVLKQHNWSVILMVVIGTSNHVPK